MLRQFAVFLLILSTLTSCSTWKVREVSQSGIASWYGQKFQGRTTASGEKFDMHQLTAAHPSLPFGTHVRVKNRNNGKSVRVRINDRGPFTKGRIIDLSFAAAEKIGMIQSGEAPVDLQID